MSLRISDEEEKLNPGQIDADNKLDLLKRTEKKGTVNPNNSGDSASVDSINKDEENPNPMNYTGGGVNDKSTTNTSFLSKVGLKIKKKSATIAIITMLGVGGIGISVSLSPVFLMQSTLANLVQKFNLQETSLTIRTDKLLLNKLKDNNTSGYCSNVSTKISIFCKFTRPSNRFLDRLKAKGIEAVDADGNLIKKNTFLPNGRPAAYRYIDSTGKKTTVDAKNFYGKLKDDAVLRDSFHYASRTRFMSLSDDVFRAIKTRFGFNVTDKLKSSKKSSDVPKKIEKELGDEVGDLAKKEFISKLASKEILKMTNKIAKSAKGPLIIAGALCAISDFPGLISKISRTFQITQLVRYSSVFLSAFGSIKAGDATPEEVSAIGDILTEVVDDKSAMDSFGMNYTINNDLNPTSDSYKKFDPTNRTIAGLGSAAKYANIVSGGCDYVTGLASTIISNVFYVATLGTINLDEAINQVTALIQPIVAEIPFDDAAEWIIGDITSELTGEDVGDALTSGAAHLMGQTANAGGNMPLTPKEAVAYNKLTNQVQLAYAEEDRATKSPFDISSPNTLLGSVVQRIAPYYLSASTSTGSFISKISFIKSFILDSFSTIFSDKVKANSADTSEYTNYCEDPMIKDTVASGPFCNIIYGVPEKYIYKEPIQVITELKEQDQIDDEGNIIENSHFSEWTANCTDGGTYTLDECMIDDDKANFSLYTIDHRIQIAMDGETDTEEEQ